MIGQVLVCLTVIGACLADEPAPATGDRATVLSSYQSARKEAGRDAQAHVRLALWCEAHGMSAERLKHLATAVLYDPSNVLARGLMGLVAYQGKWKRPEQVSRQVQDDPKRNALLQEYLQRRANSPDTADGRWKLASWCEQNGLTQQANAHFHQVVKLDPSRDRAWKHLGFKSVGGRWIKPEVVAAAKARAQEQHRADKHWRPILERYRGALQSKDPARRAKAERELAQITDRDAVPMVWATFGRADASLQKVAVQVLGQIDDGSASRALVLLAVFGGSAEVRGQATAILRRRDAREFAAMLIGMILEPVEYEVKKVRGPGQGGELLIKGQGSAPNVRRLYSPPAGPSIMPQPGDRVYLDENGLPVIARMGPPVGMVTSLGALITPQMRASRVAGQNAHFLDILAHSGLGAEGQKIAQSLINNTERQFIFNGQSYITSNPIVQAAMSAPSDNSVPPNPHSMIFLEMASGATIPVGRMALEAQKAAVFAEKQLEADVVFLKGYNASLGQINDRVVPVLEAVSGLDIGPKPADWRKWYINLIGYRFNQLQSSDNPTVVENIPLAYQPQPFPIGLLLSGPIAARRVSCFGAGTLVRTLTGLEPIETLKVGDPVLAQSTRTGALAYKPILVVHHNPPSKTFFVTLGADTVVSSEFHRFWKAGRGWVMARDLKEGDLIPTLDGPIPVSRIERGEVVPVYNLDVAEDADFFVGRGGVLVHDNTLPDLRERPFDAVDAPATTAKPSKPVP
jgi:hypothetical protein